MTTVKVNFEYEVLTPLEGFDKIYAEYAETFGRYPYDFMLTRVRQTKQDLFMWWGTNREKIRAALVAAETRRNYEDETT